METNTKAPELTEQEFSHLCTQAEQHLRIRKAVNEKDLAYDPVQIFELDTHEMSKLFTGFDLMPHWDFPRMITVLNLLKQRGEEIKDADRTIEDLTSLLLHLCQYRNLIDRKIDEYRLIAEQVEAAYHQGA